MRRLIAFAGLLSLAAVSLASCGKPAPIPPPPIEYAQTTTLDETVVIGFEKAVTASADLMTIGVKLKTIPDDKLLALKKAVAVLRKAVAGVRASYEALNSTSYAAAVVEAARALAAVDAIRTGKSL